MYLLKVLTTLFFIFVFSDHELGLSAAGADLLGAPQAPLVYGSGKNRIIGSFNLTPGTMKSIVSLKRLGSSRRTYTPTLERLGKPVGSRHP